MPFPSLESALNKVSNRYLLVSCESFANLRSLPVNTTA